MNSREFMMETETLDGRWQLVGETETRYVSTTELSRPETYLSAKYGTMVFGEYTHLDSAVYDNKQEAREGHARMVAKWLASEEET